MVSFFLALFLYFLRGFVPTFFLYCFIFFSFLFSFKDKHIDLIFGIFYRTLLHKPCVHLNPVLLCSSGLVDPLSSLSTYSLEVITVLKWLKYKDLSHHRLSVNKSWLSCDIIDVSGAGRTQARFDLPRAWECASRASWADMWGGLMTWLPGLMTPSLKSSVVPILNCTCHFFSHA